jgi:WhiB family redox-sensing transcriptional regulator
MTTPTLDWYDRAACRDHDPDLFDYDPERDPPAKAEQAKQVCAGCQVRDACLEFALSQPMAEDATGIYGGLTPAERLPRHLPETRPRGLIRDPEFAAVSHELASKLGVGRTAEQLGVSSGTLYHAWRRHQFGLPPRPPLSTGGLVVDRKLVERALQRLGWRGPLPGYPVRDPDFAATSFDLAGKLGTVPAARFLGVSYTTLYKVWDRHELGRPERPPGWTGEFSRNRALVEQAFQLARDSSILAAASAFQTTAPTLRRAFARHRLGHPHEGLDRQELQRRWNEQPGPDHRNRQQRRAYRARLSAERLTAREGERTRSRRQARSAARPPGQHERRQRPEPFEERER